MADVVNIGTKAYDVRKSAEFQPYSKVIINVQNDNGEVLSYVADDGSNGATLEYDCPWGTQAMANYLLTKVRGLQYQPFTATSALADPAVELGDAVSVNGIYSGIYTQDATFSHTFYSDISAPQDEQLENEYSVRSKTERMLSRQQAYAQANFRIQSDNIEAKVSKEGADSNSAFSWKLLSNKFSLFSTIENKTVEVFSCNSSGVTINGKIVAKSGKIGASYNSSSEKWEGGFDIGSNKITNGQTSLDSTSGGNGVYIGTDGIGLGNGKFKVTKAGDITAEGTINVKKGYIGGTSGFEIDSKRISNGTTTLAVGSSDAEQRVYIGTSGISLGKTKDANGNDVPAFKITNKGNLEAYSGKFYGTVYASKLKFTNPDGTTTTISGANITNNSLSGGKITDNSIGDGKISGVSGGKVGSGINGGNISAGTVPKGKLDSSTQGNITHGESAYNTVSGLIVGRQGFTYCMADKLWVGSGGINMDNTQMKRIFVTINGASYYIIGKKI